MLDWTKPGKKYGEMALEYGRIAGYKQNGWPIIKRSDHPQQWREWYAYYGFRKLGFMQELMRERDEKTVPSHSPLDFDLEFNPQAHQLPEVPRDGERSGKFIPQSEEARARVAELVARFQGREVEPVAPDRYRKSA